MAYMDRIFMQFFAYLHKKIQGICSSNFVTFSQNGSIFNDAELNNNGTNIFNFFILKRLI